LTSNFLNFANFAHFESKRLLEQLEKQYSGSIFNIWVVEDGYFDNVVINYVWGNLKS